MIFRSYGASFGAVRNFHYAVRSFHYYVAHPAEPVRRNAGRRGLLQEHNRHPAIGLELVPRGVHAVPRRLGTVHNRQCL